MDSASAVHDDLFGLFERVIANVDKTDLRPAKMCTCSRAAQENVVSGETCACGKRPSSMYTLGCCEAFFALMPFADFGIDSCTCAGVETGKTLPTETDFTGTK